MHFRHLKRDSARPANVANPVRSRFLHKPRSHHFGGALKDGNSRECNFVFFHSQPNTRNAGRHR